MPVLSDAQPLHDTDGGFEVFGRNSLAVLGIHCIEAQFIHWEGLLFKCRRFYAVFNAYDLYLYYAGIVDCHKNIFSICYFKTAR